MANLTEIFPDADLLLGLEPEELAQVLLEIARKNLKQGKFHPGNLLSVLTGAGMAATEINPFRDRQEEVDVAVEEGWNWLQTQGLIVQAPRAGFGWFTLSRRALQLQTSDDFDHYRAAARFPKALLHPLIADRVRIALARGDLSDAVFIAFRTVEEQVREVGRFALTDIGTQLVRNAFDKDNGPLTDQTQPEAEREALAHLFAGAIGSYKNPHSHRTVTISDPSEANEMVLLASHLLRIIDGRRGSSGSPIS
jgi:uncharacterized protein (TIGR02391 family)